MAFTHVNGAAGKKWMPETMGSGVAAFDADGDGRIDLLFVNGRYWPGDPRGAAGQPRSPSTETSRNPAARSASRTARGQRPRDLALRHGRRRRRCERRRVSRPRDHGSRRHPPLPERREGSFPRRDERLRPRRRGLGHVGGIRGLRRRRRPRPFRRPVRELDAEDGHVLLAGRENEVVLHARALQRPPPASTRVSAAGASATSRKKRAS